MSIDSDDQNKLKAYIHPFFNLPWGMGEGIREVWVGAETNPRLKNPFILLPCLL